MTFAIWKPPQPDVKNDVSVSDQVRFIQRKCWDLTKVIEAVKDESLMVEMTTKAQSEAFIELKYSYADVVSFLKNLGVSHYVNSQWCLPPYGANQHAPYPADSYAMGFDRLKKQENQRREPYAYIKFTVVEETGKVLVFSMHESQKDK